MIFNGLIYIINFVLSILLFPLQAISIGIDFLSGITPLTHFFKVIYYLLPIDKILPLFFLIIGINIFKIAISLIKTIWDLLPVF